MGDQRSEDKARHVRDAAFWGMPVGTPIEPGMKPVKPGRTGRRIRHRGASRSLVRGSRRTNVKPTSKPDNDKPSKSLDLDGLKALDADEFNLPDVAKTLGAISRDGREDAAGTVEDPIDCGSDIGKAQDLLRDGKHIRLNTEIEVSLLIDRIAEEAAQAKKDGKDAPDYNFCLVTVPNTSLFCGESKGVARIHMPQFSGQPVEGSYAATRYDDEEHESNVMDEFADLLDELGIDVETKDIPVQNLKATQNELVGAKVAGIRQAMRDGKIEDKAIYVTRDGYVVDGHHRWAAKMALDLEDGKLGDVAMPVKMIDADIGYILDLSNGFTRLAGIKAKATGKQAEGVKMISVQDIYLGKINEILDRLEGK